MIERAPWSDNLRGMHLAFIMDGNGRWANARGLPRFEGHRAGATTARRAVEAALDRGIGTVTLFALSADNFRRPPREVSFLLQLLRRFLRLEKERCIERGVRLRVIGNRDRLPAKVVALIREVERATAHGDRMLLRIAVDFSSRDSILAAARRLAEETPTNGNGRAQDVATNGADASSDARAHEHARFARALADVYREPEPAPDVDLVIRTGGESRLSDFLLWECAYAELYFTQTMWPEFECEELDRALGDFAGRERRFGLVPTNGASRG